MASLGSILFVCLLFSSYDIGVEGGTRFISKEEDIELDRQLKFINKPAIKSIQTKYGDKYDCVDFYKQPAFDHPMLKNHTFHPRMRPFSVPKLMKETEHFKAKSSSKTSYVGLERVACPLGTVPIRRVTKDDLIREKLHSKIHSSQYSVLETENPGTHYAVVQTKPDPKNKYNGGGAHIFTYNPSDVTGSQYSSGRMKIQNGAESIQTGWTVNPTLYGDNRTRHYIYLETSQSRCFNTRCPGFVIVDSTITIGGLLFNSEKGQRKHEVLSLIFKDQPVGNWWLEVMYAKIKVGFWPERIFTSLSNFATSVEWGGEVFSPPGVPSPQMGTGILPSDFIDPADEYIAGCLAITTVNEANQIVNAVNTQKYRDIKHYESTDAYYRGSWIHHAIFFGGPGGAT